MTNISSWRMYALNLQIPVFTVVVYWHWLFEGSHMLQRGTLVYNCVFVWLQKNLHYVENCAASSGIWIATNHCVVTERMQFSSTVWWKPEITLCIMVCLLACCHSSVMYNPVVGCIQMGLHHILAMGKTWGILWVRGFYSYLRNGAS